MTEWKSRQNGDGGWAYGRGCSWTEPTVFALLAQSALAGDLAHSGLAGRGDAAADGSCASPDCKPDRESFRGGVRFLGSIARRDGGFSPQPGVEESTWVTALVALLPEDAVRGRQRHRAIEWLKDRAGRESGWQYRLQQRLAGVKDDYPEGWPWYPGAAAWVVPTSLGILAFERALRHGGDEGSAGLLDRVQSGREFLLKRMCADGGWNHGANRALGRDGDSYPETTGIALLALGGLASSKGVGAKLERAKAAARKHLAACRTAEGIAWLRMGLAAHGETPEVAFDPVRRTNMDEALMTLAAAPRNPLLA